ncbi:hypothetical protein B0H11DRAFT_2165553 [Mycena galericulata]|nr:hypothetical protein B0H11DRAFT_2165553 [Mycena galericulata]
MTTHAGACFCGSVSYTVTGKPTLSAYCHCTRCQVRSACIWTIHFPGTAFTWTHSQPHSAAISEYVTEGKPWKTRYRCSRCGCCVACFNTKTEEWSVWGSQLEREDGTTKNLDVLGKWEGYENKSKRIV